MFKLLLELAASIYYFALHVTGSGAYPQPLSAKKETELLEKSQNGDIDARNTLVEHNLRLVAHIVKKYYATGAEQDDLISIGTIGLIKAVSTFKPDKNIRLATYASRCIEKVILSVRPHEFQITVKYAIFTPKSVKKTLSTLLPETRCYHPTRFIT